MWDANLGTTTDMWNSEKATHPIKKGKSIKRMKRCRYGRSADHVCVGTGVHISPASCHQARPANVQGEKISGSFEPTEMRGCHNKIRKSLMRWKRKRGHNWREVKIPTAATLAPRSGVFAYEITICMYGKRTPVRIYLHTIRSGRTESSST